MKVARQSARRSSCILIILMMIFAAVALLAKWSIIQPIHDEVVRKYQTNQSVYYVPNSICKVINLQKFNVLTFPVACFLIILFIIRTKRTSLWRNKCHGYGGPPMPVDFLSRMDRKFAAVIFAICADELLLIMEEVLFDGASKGNGVIVDYLIRISQVIFMGFRYYPLLAAVYIDSIFTLAAATLYAWLDYAVTIVNLGMCRIDFYPTYEEFLDDSSGIDTLFEYYGTGPNLIAIQLCTDIPRFLCITYVCVKLPMLLVEKIYYRVKKDIPFEKRMMRKLTREQRTFFYISRPESVEMQYVRNLFRSAEHRPRSHALLARLIPKKIYEWRDDFQFSTRVLCVYSSICLLLYFVTIQACVRVVPYLSIVQDLGQAVVDAVSVLFLPIPDQNSTDTTGQDVTPTTSNFKFPKLIPPYLCAVFLTLIIIVTQLLVLLVGIRRNLMQSFRGDDVELPRRLRSKYISLSTGNIHFAGYFIGYLIWGFMIIAVFSSIICICLAAFITFGSVRLLEVILKAIIPSLLFVFFKQYLNRILAQYVFLQHYGEVLSLNNRRLLMIFIYFNFFLDAFLGFISSILRLIKSFIAGLFYMSRLDYSPFGRKLETMDGGFSSYCGFIHTECAHRHPVMLVAVSLLYTEIKRRELMMQASNFDDIKRVKPLSRYARKWKLAVFLIRNPTIVFFRKTFLNQLHIDEIHELYDVDDNGKKNMQRRLSVYARRMSAAQLSAHSFNIEEPIERQKF